MDSTLLSGLAGGLAVAVIVFFMSRTKARSLENGVTLVRMHPTFLVILLVVSVFLSVGMVALAYVLVMEGDYMTSVLGLVMGILAACAVPFVLIALFTKAYDIVVDDQGVTGPGTLYGLGISKTRHTISWSDMRKLGETWLQSRYVENTQGRRIYWSQYYSGYTELEARIAANLPASDF